MDEFCTAEDGTKVFLVDENAKFDCRCCLDNGKRRNTRKADTVTRHFEPCKHAKMEEGDVSALQAKICGLEAELKRARHKDADADSEADEDEDEDTGTEVATRKKKRTRRAEAEQLQDSVGFEGQIGIQGDPGLSRISLCSSWCPSAFSMDLQCWRPMTTRLLCSFVCWLEVAPM